MASTRWSQLTIRSNLYDPNPCDGITGTARIQHESIFLSRDHEEWSPWLWGVNGAASVLDSVLSIAISLNSSITASYWVAVLCYVGVITCFAALPAAAKSR